jgi:hypothetical protein
MREEKGSDLLISKLLDVEKTTLGTDIDLSQVVYSVDDRSSGGASDSVVVGFANSSNRGDVRLDEVMLSEI